jgi:hypothetical protein
LSLDFLFQQLKGLNRHGLRYATQSSQNRHTIGKARHGKGQAGN